MSQGELSPLRPIVNDDNDVNDLSNDLSHPTDGQTRYSPTVATIYLINYTFGSGILAIPYYYYKTGYILNTVVLAWCGLLTFIICRIVSNLVYRGEAISRTAIKYGLSINDIVDNPDKIIQTLTDDDDDDNNNIVDYNDFISEYNFVRNRFELNQLIGLFGGKKYRIFYDVLYFFGSILCLAGYIVLFGASFTRFGGINNISNSCNIEKFDYKYNSDCYKLYVFYCCMFYIWCIILILIDLPKQKYIQVLSFIGRIIIVSLIVITSIGLLYGNLEYSSSTGKYTKRSSGSSGSGYAHYADDITPWSWNGIFYSIAVSISAFSCQYSIPDVIEPLSIHNRNTKQNRIIGTSIFTLYVVFVLVGITVSIYFGNNTEDPCTLAWEYFMGFIWNDGERPVWSYIVAYIILLLPAVDMMSAFPLNAITVSNNIESTIFNLEQLYDHDNKDYKRTVSIVTRICLTTLAMVIAIIFWDFGLVVTISGAFGLINMFALPCYIEYKSQKMCDIITNNPNAKYTPVTDWTTHIFWSYAVYITVVVSEIAIIVDAAT